MKFTHLLFTFSLLFTGSFTVAQDTLPKFVVKNLGNENVVIGWNNNYESVKQISIQRSHDSLKNYKTIMSVTDPNSKQNGFADVGAPNDHMFYRLFIVLGSGEYFFTNVKKPVLDSFSTTNVTLPINNIRKNDFISSFYVYTNKDGYLYINLPDADQKRYRIKFYEEDDTFLFELKNITETGLTLDKSNFIHAGWFKFELFNEERLVEKNKFYLSKDY